MFKELPHIDNRSSTSDTSDSQDSKVSRRSDPESLAATARTMEHLFKAIRPTATSEQ